MIDKEIIPLKATRKLHTLFLHNKALLQDKILQQKIISWAEDMLDEARNAWFDTHSTTMEAIISCARKQEAKRRAAIKDKKYAPFREYFKDLQYKKFKSYRKQGKTLTANAFVKSFLRKKVKEVDIPYKSSNAENKLYQLAQANNREFKKAFA